jgi:hypothetical protein
MAVDYKVVEISGSYCVQENATGHVINQFNNIGEAKKYMKFLNLGGGFSGWTPNFIVSKSTSALNKNSKNM